MKVSWSPTWAIEKKTDDLIRQSNPKTRAECAQEKTHQSTNADRTYIIAKGVKVKEEFDFKVESLMKSDKKVKDEK